MTLDSACRLTMPMGTDAKARLIAPALGGTAQWSDSEDIWNEGAYMNEPRGQPKIYKTWAHDTTRWEDPIVAEVRKVNGSVCRGAAGDPQRLRHKEGGVHMLKGSCACGRIHYEIRGGLIGPVTYCHCWRCRKHSGSSFGTTAGVKATSLIFVSGRELLRSWESSPGVYRFFAGCCGSPIYKRQDATPEVLGFRLGTLDTDPSGKVELHFMVGSKAPWVEIDDGLRQEPGGVSFGERD